MISFLSFCFQDLKKISKDTKTYPELGTLKSGVFFTTRKLKTLSTQFSETTAEYKKKQSKLVGEIVAIAGRYMRLIAERSQLT